MKFNSIPTGHHLPSYSLFFSPVSISHFFLFSLPFFHLFSSFSTPSISPALLFLFHSPFNCLCYFSFSFLALLSSFVIFLHVCISSFQYLRTFLLPPSSSLSFSPTFFNLCIYSYIFPFVVSISLLSPLSLFLSLSYFIFRSLSTLSIYLSFFGFLLYTFIIIVFILFIICISSTFPPSSVLYFSYYISSFILSTFCILSIILMPATFLPTCNISLFLVPLFSLFLNLSSS